MAFNSIDFAWFLPAVFALYWFACGRNRRAQNLLLVAASGFFYGWWDWRFLGLIAASSLVNYAAGLRLASEPRPRWRKALLWACLAANLGMLGFFKYYGFFVENFADAFSLFGGRIETGTLHIILPVGISFYTFQALSYTLDIYRGTFKPTRDPVAFLAFVSFFPQLVAGPIERASGLLPQFTADRRFDPAGASDGLRRILWGLFKKLVVADNCAPLVGRIFDDPGAWSGSTLALGAVLFAFQIYCDFSGYSDIATGTARLFGITLTRNFAYPYFSRDVAEFWRRWHITLTSWFRDYVYIPLGGGRGGIAATVRNVFIVFALSGLWHGANRTFVIWGLLNALFFLPLLLRNRTRRPPALAAADARPPSLRDAPAIAATFALTCLAWIFFRSESLGRAVEYLSGLLSPSLFSAPEILPGNLVLPIGLLLAMEWSSRAAPHALGGWVAESPRALRWSVYAAVLAVIGLLRSVSGNIEFIYFQF